MQDIWDANTQSPTAVDDTIDPSLNINAVEEKLTKTRRVSHSSYQQRLSLKKESLKKKTSLEENNEPANIATWAASPDS